MGPGGVSTGYLHPRYAGSFAEFGDVRPLERCGAWLLVRPIGGTARQDALAGYRHLFCRDWASLGADLADCRDVVSVTAVTDPLACVHESDLRRVFPDLVRAYKDNRVIDLEHVNPSRHHRTKIRKATRVVHVRREPDAAACLEDWDALYAVLCERHGIRGIKALSTRAFREQLATPGCVVFRATSASGDTLAMLLWYVMGDAVHYHLGASSAAGYRVSASYALMDAAIDAFAREGLRWLNLGAAAGAEARDGDGLARFKTGWTDLTRPSYLCGRIVDAVEYARLADARRLVDREATYFPAYRAGEHD